jgi:hypothetical protein
MSEDRRKVLSRRPATAAYEVGYGKPPVHSRFRPGQSGNPKGRPRGSRNRPAPPALHEERLKTLVLEEAYRTISVNDASGVTTIPMAQAIIRSLAVNAAKGHQRAQRLFTELLATTERDNKRLYDQFLEVAITYKVEWERELERRHALGITGPEPLPHPDHVVVDLCTGTVRITGPATKEEKAQWDLWLERKALSEEELQELEALRDDPDYPDKKIVLQKIEWTKKVLEIIRRIVG